MIKILIVDDSKIIRSVLVGYFKQFEVQILVAANGEHGVALYKEKNPDIVLMDMHMPGMSGIDAMREIIKHDKDAKVCMLSSDKEKSAIKMAVIAGAKGYVVKPFQYDKLRATVDYILGSNIREKEDIGNVSDSLYQDTIRILIAEDNVFMHSMYEKYLGKYDIYIEFVEDGFAAVERYKTYRADLIFMDIIMPIVDGIKATKMIIDNDPAANICMVTSLSDYESMDKAQLAGAKDYLFKPLVEEELINVIENTLEIPLTKKNQSDEPSV